MLPTNATARGYDLKQSKRRLFAVKCNRPTDSFIEILSSGALHANHPHGRWPGASYKIFHFLSVGEYLISWRLPQPQSLLLLLCLTAIIMVMAKRRQQQWVVALVGFADRVPYKRQQSTPVQTGFNCQCPLREWRSLARMQQSCSNAFVFVWTSFKCVSCAGSLAPGSLTGRLLTASCSIQLALERLWLTQLRQHTHCTKFIWYLCMEK